MKLRDYQSAAIDDLREAIRRGARRPLLMLPTGAGKTVVMSAMIASATGKQRKTWLLAHRRELIDQASAKLDAYNVPHGVIMPGHWRSRPDLPVQVGSVQTVAARIRKGSLPASPDLVFFDEAHHVCAGQWQAIVDAFPRARYIGVTATPVRLDGRGLGEVFDDLTLGPSIADMIAMGHLVPIRHYAPSSPALHGVKRKKSGDFSDKQLEEVTDKPQIVGDIVEHFQRLAGNRKTVVFAVSIRHSMHIVERFRQAGISAAHVDGQMATGERSRILSDLAAGRVQVVSNVNLLTEGWDCPDVSCCVLARPTQSASLYLQMAGRALRPAPGKTDCLILDHAACAEMHGLVTSPREWSLDGKKKREKDPDNLPIKLCNACFATTASADWERVENGRKCPVCGEVEESVTRELTEADGELREVEAEPVKRHALTKHAKRALHAAYKRTAEARGYKSGWAAHRYKERVGVWPRGLGNDPETAEILAWLPCPECSATGCRVTPARAGGAKLHCSECGAFAGHYPWAEVEANA